MMEVKIYIDVMGDEKSPTDFEPFTDKRPHPKKGRRYCLTVELPELAKPRRVKNES